MKSKKTSQNDVARGTPRAQAAAGNGSADGQGGEAAKAHGDAHAMNQAARAVMHPEGHEPEWRFYHGAVHG